MWWNRLLGYPNAALNPLVGSETMAGPSIMLYNLMGMFWNILERLASLERMAEEKTPLVVAIACALEARPKNVKNTLTQPKVKTFYYN